MKRPRLLYFVAGWCCLALLIQVGSLMPPAKAYEAAGDTVAALWSIVRLIAFAFVIWQTVALVQLKRFNRWFAVGFFSLWSATLVWNATLVLRSHPVTKVVYAAVLFSVLVCLNLLSAWFLSRRSFREFAHQYEKERHSRLMEKTAQKAVQDEIRGMR